MALSLRCRFFVAVSESVVAWDAVAATYCLTIVMLIKMLFLMVWWVL